MQPSSDQSSSGAEGGGSALKRFGPIIAIVVVVAVVAAVVIVGGGDDDETTAPGPDTTEGTGSQNERPEGAISWSQAQEEGLDVEFPDTCDPETGRVAIPYFFAPECYANVDDNGGATARGVTEDSIKVVYYSAPEEDAVLDYITGPIGNDDTRAQIEETALGFIELFNEYYQSYGRTVEVEVLEASGQSQDEVAARADAKRAVEEMGAFAVLGGPALTNAWTDEIAAQGAICIGCPGGSQEFYEDRAPYVVSVGMGSQQNNLHVAQYVEARLAGEDAEFGGEAVQDTPRKFGHLYIRSSEESDANAQQLDELLAERGIDVAEEDVLSYELDPGRLAEQATSVISKFKASGVTTILLQADPIAPANFTQEATAQDYFPEWVIAGGTLVDTTVFGREYDQEQWQHAFGISSLSARSQPELNPGFSLYEWYHGEPPPAIDTAPVIYPNPSLFFSTLQEAGPDLTPETFRDGLFSGEPTAAAITNPSLSWGDHGLWDELGIETDWNGTDDKTEIWWDADATGVDEIESEGTGMMRYVDGGKRYLPGQWDETDQLFEEDGSVTVYEEPPEEETPPDYPSPAEG